MHEAADSGPADLPGREAVWRALLWDGAPDGLATTLALWGALSPSEVTPGQIAELAASGALPRLEDALELHRLAVEARVHAARTKATREAGLAGKPRVAVEAEAGMVVLRVREDLKAHAWFALPPREADRFAVELQDAARDAMRMLGR